MTSQNRIFLGFLLCVFVFLGTWYDTTHLHILTAPLNDYIQHVFAAQAYPPSGAQSLYLQTLKDITALGEKPVCLVTVGFLFIMLAEKKEWKAVFYCLLTILVIVMITKFMKHSIYSPRPIPFSAEHDSFPSGHTTRATLWCGLFLMMNQLRYIVVSRYTQYILVLIPLFVGFSRMGLSRHWFSDVIGAYAVTIALFLILFCLFDRYRKKS